MKILVTGGAGFIGSNLSDRLIKEGYDVVVVDNLASGRIENINPKGRFYQMDIRDKNLSFLFEKERPDFVSHHAAQIDVRKSVAEPIFDAEVNVLGTINILENCRKYGVKRVVFASSGGVLYGEVEKGKKAKEDFPTRPISPYGITKLCVEKYLEFYQETYGMNHVILRYANVYGRRQDPFGEAGVVAIFIQKMLKKETPTIFGDGSQERDYVCVDDVVEANLSALSKGDNCKLNIGTEVTTSVQELFLQLQKIIGFTKEPNLTQERPGELQRSCLDISKAKSLLDWAPKKNLAKGLAETVEYFRKGSDI
ncbi:MAG: GDP-mannose 4,6-dehydratase [bacterium]|nr:GDP-mannose 4,6-dehydratase [bacterium]